MRMKMKIHYVSPHSFVHSHLQSKFKSCLNSHVAWGIGLITTQNSDISTTYIGFIYISWKGDSFPFLGLLFQTRKVYLNNMKLVYNMQHKRWFLSHNPNSPFLMYNNQIDHKYIYLHNNNNMGNGKQKVNIKRYKLESAEEEENEEGEWEFLQIYYYY